MHYYEIPPEKVDTNILRQFVTCEGGYEYDGDPAGLSFFGKTERIQIAYELSARTLIHYSEKRLEDIRIVVHEPETMRPNERDARTGDHTYLDWAYRIHTEWGWKEHECQGGACWYHVILDAVPNATEIRQNIDNLVIEADKAEINILPSLREKYPGARIHHLPHWKSTSVIEISTGTGDSLIKEEIFLSNMEYR